ncbi:L-lysine 2,3-aminomutase [Symmachiella dynata]|uniref:EF-P beta-lysylation protein EpmB n=1 Tax=Symmachiella dynata TaxID=2527995 RepID=UPI00118C6B3A|nr:EF-P beta-lysylation protein EpmB [Symmachiella dynata]QDT46617.1 L-lysine 2,3-aminomutase [Symmachiella dynata]
MPTPPATTRQTLSPQQDTANWHRALAAAVRDPDELIDLLGLGDDYREPARRATRLFPLLVPRNYLERIEPGNPRDPLLLQVLPLAAEETVVDGFSADAVGDAQAHRSPGLLQKYTGRALLITTGACAVHCRYCFRREFPYGEEPRTMEDWEPAFADIAADSSLHEIILSGGDPLMLTDARLAMFIERLDRIEHLRRLRIHTRLPIVLPQRVTDTLLEMITSTRMTPIVVVHANHAHELQGDCAAALRELVRGGVTVLNQAVLLRGINDTTASQAELCERLVNLGVIPYYLHQLDRVSGAAHFEVPEQTGRVIIAELRERLPGYAVPQFVREIAGESHKTPL